MVFVGGIIWDGVEIVFRKELMNFVGKSCVYIITEVLPLSALVIIAFWLVFFFVLSSLGYIIVTRTSDLV